MRRDGEHVPVSAKTLARRLPEEAWRIVPWREGSNEILSSRFAAVRIRPASRDWKASTPHPLEWLLIEWPEGEKEPTKYWLSTLPEDTPVDILADTAKLRWRIERDYRHQQLGVWPSSQVALGWVVEPSRDNTDERRPYVEREEPMQPTPRRYARRPTMRFVDQGAHEQAAGIVLRRELFVRQRSQTPNATDRHTVRPIN